jgi:hypothetical protein
MRVTTSAPAVRGHVAIPDDVTESAVPLEPGRLWGGRRRWRQLTDQMIMSGLAARATTTVEVEGGRPAWWRQRRRLGGRYGVTAKRIVRTEWSLTREPQ